MASNSFRAELRGNFGRWGYEISACPLITISLFPSHRTWAWPKAYPSPTLLHGPRNLPCSGQWVSAQWPGDCLFPAGSAGGCCPLFEAGGWPGPTHTQSPLIYRTYPESFQLLQGIPFPVFCIQSLSITQDNSKKSSLVSGVQGALNCLNNSLGTETMSYTSLCPLQKWTKDPAQKEALKSSVSMFHVSIVRTLDTWTYPWRKTLNLLVTQSWG